MANRSFQEKLAERIAGEVSRAAFRHDPTLTVALASVFFSTIVLLIGRLESRDYVKSTGKHILAFATRDATFFSGIPYYIIPIGRRHGLSSRAVDVSGNLPTPNTSVKERWSKYSQKKVEQNLRTLPWIRRLRLVSIGHVSAAKFRYGGIRRSKVTAKRKNVLYEAIRRMNVAPIGYQDMARDPMTAEIVRRLAFEPRIWKKSFTRAMVRLSRVDVITGNAGEIRKNCRLVN
ncbi:peroxidase 57-like [Cucumis melo var. makuwa]|uniref:peroxidase n=1 Tax=Cucumis melo var. makuwa TaxID=1194695 RepID=A0A5A7SYK9_CUCMM|nr:peroxidase 57-like [Cucumis melo var. makuwa]